MGGVICDLKKIKNNISYDSCDLNTVRIVTLVLIQMKYKVICLGKLKIVELKVPFYLIIDCHIIFQPPMSHVDCWVFRGMFQPRIILPLVGGHEITNIIHLNLVDLKGDEMNDDALVCGVALIIW